MIDESIISRFDRVAGACPDRQAVGGTMGTLTYGALSELTARVAHQLLESGAAAGDRVALLFDRGPLACAALFGVMRSGAVAVPLLPSYPADRLREIIDDATPRFVVTSRMQAATARSAVPPHCVLIEIEALPSAPAREWPLVAGSQAASILYTSGSTGRPKGVVHTHRAMLQKVDRVASVLGPAAGDRIATFSTYAVAQGHTAIKIALLFGATLCPFDVRREGVARLAAWLVEERISLFISSASLFRSIARSLDAPGAFPDLRLVRLGSERVTPADVAAQRRLWPEARLVVGYATTETGAIAMNAIGRDDEFPGGIVPVGRPLPGIAVSILDDDGQVLPAGVEGEIVVSSAYLSQGYWRNEEASARVFAAATDASGEQTYRTGDLGRLTADGLLEHRGRKDLRVKIRGFRVEIEEIETVLGQAPGVARAAVDARPGPDGDLRLVGYVQPAPGAELTVDALREYLAVRLPEHMLPAAFVFLDELPLTDSAKVARPQLPEPSPDRPSLSSRCVLPRNAMETVVADVWREVLGLDTIGVHDAFLSVGGDSLKATLVASRLATRVGVELPLWVLFEASTVAELAIAVEQHLASEPRA